MTTQPDEKKENRGWYLEGMVTDVTSFKTKKGTQLFRIYVLVGRQTQSVTSRQNNLQVGDHYRAWVQPQPYINKYGAPALSCWELKRV